MKKSVFSSILSVMLIIALLAAFVPPSSCANDRADRNVNLLNAGKTGSKEEVI